MEDRSEGLQADIRALRGRRETLAANRGILTRNKANFAAEAASLGQLVAAHESWELDINSVEQELVEEDQNIKDELRNLEEKLRLVRSERHADRAYEDNYLKDVAGEMAKLAGSINPPAKKDKKRRKK